MEHYYNLVEKVIKELGVDPVICRGDKEGQWNLNNGTANIWVDVWKQEDKDYGYIQIMGPVSKVPHEKELEFYREMMEINHGLYACSITKFENWIHVKSIRELEDLSESEVLAMFDRVSYYVNYYDEYIKNKYFTKPVKRTE
ncbi:MAG TPA: YbjN domain-containing protein [Bacteroidales bacterium]|nr:YbjN domain-containing protein [Bacteroidales bacterium]HPS16519.1 YbjN domain-containing protein [Bacteroidales bacterium]